MAMLSASFNRDVIFVFFSSFCFFFLLLCSSLFLLVLFSSRFLLRCFLPVFFFFSSPLFLKTGLLEEQEVEREGGTCRMLASYLRETETTGPCECNPIIKKREPAGTLKLYIHLTRCPA